MTAVPTDILPDRLVHYAPGRITEVPDAAWPAALRGGFDPNGVRTSIPRYALDLYVPDRPVDPRKVAALLAGPSARALHDRDVYLASHAGRVWVVGGRVALAAHLARGAERLPVRLIRSFAHQPPR